MALGFGNRKEAPAAEINSPVLTGPAHMRDPAFQTGVYGYDTEKQAHDDRKGSRVGGPVSGVLGDSDAESAISVNKQMELEATNSIKYRSCSWQKVK